MKAMHSPTAAGLLFSRPPAEPATRGRDVADEVTRRTISFHQTIHLATSAAIAGGNVPADTPAISRPSPRAASRPSPLAAQGRLPLAFMGLALAWLGAATVMLVLSPEVLALSHAAPAVVSLAHAWVLGVFVTAATGAVYQIAPVALGTTLWSERYGWWHFGLQAVSIPGMIWSFSRWDMAELGHFGSAFGLGIGLFAVNTWKTVRRSGQRDAVAWSLIVSAGWLLLTVLAGLVFAANRFWQFIPLDPLALLRAHAHLGLIGFFLTLLQGVSFRLVPMFTLGDVPDWRPVRAGLWLSQLGLLGLAPALAWQSGALALGSATLVVAGMLASGWALRQTLATRRKRALDPGLRAFVGGLVVLLVAAVAGCALLWPGSPWGSAPGGFNAMVYAVLVFAGGLLPLIAGMMSKIVPFLTWMRAYGPKVGREPTPAAGALSSPRLESPGFLLQALAPGPLVVGVWIQDSLLLGVGAWLLGAGVALYLASLLGVLRHLWRSAAVVPVKAAG